MIEIHGHAVRQISDHRAELRQLQVLAAAVKSANAAVSARERLRMMEDWKAGVARMKANAAALTVAVGKSSLIKYYVDVAERFKLNLVDGWEEPATGAGQVGSSVKGKLTKNAYYLLIFVPAKPKVPALPAGKPGAPAPPADEEDEQHAMALYVPVHTFKDGCHLQLFDPNIGILRVHFEHNGERLISEVFDSYKDDDGKSSPFDRWKLFRVMRK